MRAAVLRNGEMVVDEVAEPVPGAGQVLVDVLACGICGSDLHFVRHGRTMVELAADAMPMPMTLDFDRDIVMGHEFAAAVLEAGPDTVAPASGTVVTSIPVLLEPTGIKNLAYSNDYPGAYAERMLLSAAMLLEVPKGLAPEHAALTEPMAVGVHAVNKSGIKPGEAAVVLGCGPVGLAVIASLKLHGIETIVAADFSPARRLLASTMGATEVVDPKDEPAVEAWRRVDGRHTLVIFEAVGVTGMLGAAMRDAPPAARICVVGVCMEEDRIIPFHGIGKELNVQFALGYDPGEFGATLRHIAEGDFDVAPLITGTVDIAGVPAAFDELASPDKHAKILVRPRR